MTAPKRVRPGGDLFHRVVPDGAVDVTRPSRFGNPFPVAEHGREEALRLFTEWLAGDPAAVALARERGCRLKLYGPALVDAARQVLAGRDLACWCLPGVPCHADILLAVVAGGEQATPETPGTTAPISPEYAYSWESRKPAILAEAAQREQRKREIRAAFAARRTHGVAARHRIKLHRNREKRQR